MATPLNINEALLQEALALDDQVSIDSLVETALREYIQRRKRQQLLAEVQEIRQEVAEGEIKYGSVKDFLAELDA